mmetsp:Transcript_51626/g.160176  ORF Transcript_51626/g.160176 Transcript_51626/m.160176 type:complete len:617 (-) Transcript_51626:79-1929(-)
MGAALCKPDCCAAESEPAVSFDLGSEFVSSEPVVEALHSDAIGSPRAFYTDAADRPTPPPTRRHRSRWTQQLSSTGSLSQLEWLNFFISHTWPQLDQLASHFVKHKIEPLLQQRLPARLKGLKLSKFTIGERPGMIRLVEVYDLPHGTSCLHVNLEYLSDMVVDWDVKGWTVGMRNLRIEGQMVLLLRPFIEEHPGTGGVTMFFINPPELDFQFTGMARIAEYRGIKGMVLSVLEDAIAGMMVLPNVVTQLMRYSDFSLYPMVMGDPTPMGLLRVKALKAFDMTSGDFTLFGLLGGGVEDNYIIASLSNVKWRTKVNKKSLGGTHDFYVYDPEQRFKIDLWDEDTYTDDDHLGTAGPFSLAEAVGLSGRHVNLVDTVDKSKSAGTLVLEIHYYKGMPRELSPVLNAVMLPIREVHLPPSKADSKVVIKASFGEVEETTRVGVVMRSRLKDAAVSSVLADMEKRLRGFGLKEEDVKRLTAPEGLECKSAMVEVAMNHCSMFMVGDRDAVKQPGEIKMRLVELVESQQPVAKKGKKPPPPAEVELGRCVITLKELREAPDLTLKGPFFFKEEKSGMEYKAEVSPFLCGFQKSQPARLDSKKDLSSIRRTTMTSVVNDM